MPPSNRFPAIVHNQPFSVAPQRCTLSSDCVAKLAFYLEFTKYFLYYFCPADNKAEEKAGDKGQKIALLTEKLEQIEGADKENKELKAAAAEMQSKIQELENIIADQKRAEKEAALTAKIELSDALRKQDKDIAKLTAKVELLEQQKKEAAEKAEAQQKEIIELKAKVQQKTAEAAEAEKKAAEAAKKVEAPQRKRTQKKTEE